MPDQHEKDAGSLSRLIHIYHYQNWQKSLRSSETAAVSAIHQATVKHGTDGERTTLEPRQSCSGRNEKRGTVLGLARGTGTF